MDGVGDVTGAEQSLSSPSIETQTTTSRMASSQRNRSPGKSFLSDRFRNASRGLPPAPQQQQASKAPSAPAAKTPSVDQQRADALELISNDLTATLTAWSAQVERLYGNAPPVAEVAVTIVAATGISLLQQPFWVASVAGVADQTETSVPLDVATMQAPLGAPSWQSDSLTLAVHDPTADLLLLLCEAGGTSALNACVGRAVVPLSTLLPLVPLGCCAQPATLETWVDIFPAAAEYAAGTVQPLLGAQLDEVEGSGMVRPAQKGRALVRVCLTLHRSLLTAYMHSPPFDVTAGASAVNHAARVAVPPERVQLTAARVRMLLGACSRPPACVRLIAKRPWTSGLALLALAAWVCFGLSPPMLPWCLLTAWVLNSYSLAAERALELAPPPWAPVPLSVESGTHAAPPPRPPLGVPPTLPATKSAETRLEALETTLLPLLEALETASSHGERALALFSFADPRVSALALCPTILLAAALSAVLAVLSAPVSLVGGWPNAAFGATAATVVLNILSFHRSELFAAWSGDDAAAGAPSPRSGRIGPGSSAAIRMTTDSPRYDDDDDGDFLNTERRRALAGWVRSHFTWVSCLWERVPDAPTREHRAIARAATASAVQADKQRVFPPCF